MTDNKVTIEISDRKATVSMIYNGQEYKETWSRTAQGYNFHLESNRDEVSIPDTLTNSIDPKFITQLMDEINK